MHTTKEQMEKVILIGFSELSELSELAKTANLNVIGELIQPREMPHPKSYFGKGKLEELKLYATELNATMVIADDELSSNQIKHMSEVLEIKVIDRTMLILDIFASNAKSAEAIAQVEIAQQRYNLARLTGFGINMSRLGAGIGTKGPGEKKLETDRRAIRARIDELSKELENLENHRATLRKSRMKNSEIILSLVGYTNAGKSTLMNYLTNANILSENKLFSTLDTTTRKMQVDSREILITDTVGFIKKLPHTLIKAFRSTLEELKYATIILHIVDVSNKNHKEHMDVVYETLEHLECNNIPIITVFNKIDNTSKIDIFTNDEKASNIVGISAKTGENIDELLKIIEKTLGNLTTNLELLIPYSQGDVLSSLHKDELIIEKEYQNDGIFVKANVDNKNIQKYKNFCV
ncbi:MAG: GTPase HflX [Defluviitaleaceae bacterium]|nr:GTPase HflX [Defluviitaleaceae bacterium]